MDTNSIPAFFSGKSVFLTGTTGLVGKLVLEKLLRCCSDVKTVYVVIRTKKNKEGRQRLKQLFDLPAFERLKQKHPDFEKKVVLLEGDFDKAAVGLSQEDVAMLQNTVDCVIHCAAAVRFNETLKRVTTVNVKGTKEVLDLARKMKNLKAFVYVSTAYSFCPRKTIDEVIYDVPLGYKGLTTIMDILGDDMEVFKDLIINKWQWPNTYSFSKAVTENMIADYTDLPMAIVRPSILIGCEKEPLPGWVDTVQSVCGVLLGAGLGVVRTFQGHMEKVGDLLPVDYLVNMILAAAWAVAETDEFRGQIKVFNCVTGPDAPIRWADLKDYGTGIVVKEAASIKMIWYPFIVPVRSSTAYNLLKLLLHTLPGLIFDTFAILGGREERLWKVYKKVDEANSALLYFSTHEWDFKNRNTKQLWSKMSKRDKETFYFDVESIEWKTCLVSVALGLRLYIVKDSIETLAEAKSKYLRMKIAHYVLVGCLFFIMLMLLCRLMFCFI